MTLDHVIKVRILASQPALFSVQRFSSDMGFLLEAALGAVRVRRITWLSGNSRAWEWSWGKSPTRIFPDWTERQKRAWNFSITVGKISADKAGGA
jgi:hypothetical protein